MLEDLESGNLSVFKLLWEVCSYRNGEMRGGIGWQHMANYLSILHAKSAAKQTQSQLFHPCFFTKILWSGFAYCNLDSILDPKTRPRMESTIDIPQSP